MLNFKISGGGGTQAGGGGEIPGLPPLYKTLTLTYFTGWGSATPLSIVLANPEAVSNQLVSTITGIGGIGGWSES